MTTRKVWQVSNAHLLEPVTSRSLYLNCFGRARRRLAWTLALATLAAAVLATLAAAAFVGVLPAEGDSGHAHFQGDKDRSADNGEDTALATHGLVRIIIIFIIHIILGMVWRSSKAHELRERAQI